MLRNEIKRVAEVLDLLEADHAGVLAFALAAAAHGEAQRDVAEIVEHRAGASTFDEVLVAAEAVQHQERGALLARLYVVWHANGAVELQAGRGNADSFFRHARQLLLRLVETEFAPARLDGIDILLLGHTVGGKRAPPRSGSGS